MALSNSILRELRTYFLSLDRKSVISGDIKPDTDDTLRLGAPSKRLHALYVNRLVVDSIEGVEVGGGSATGGQTDTLGVDYLTATIAPTVGNLYPLQDDGSGNPLFPYDVLPDDIVTELSTPTFTEINVTTYVDGVDIGSHTHSGAANMGQQISHANLKNLSADHHTIYTRWDDNETIVKKWKFSNLADTNQSFNEYVGWEIEASVALNEITGTYYPDMDTAQSVLQTLSYADPTGVATASINATGADYAVEDILTIVGGNNDATIEVTSIDGSGAITGFDIVLEGSAYSTSTASATTVLPVGGTGCTIDVDTITDYSAYTHSYPLQIISHAQYAAITLGASSEIVIKTNYDPVADTGDTWIDVGNIEISNTNGITIGSTFKVTQAGIMTATAGYIADWQILSDKLQSASGDVILDADGFIQLSGGGDIELRMSAIHTDYRLWLGSEGEANWDESTAKFIVNTAGQVVAESVYVKGLIGNYGSPSWYITSDGHAEFESIKARGRLDTLVFTKSTVSSISGLMSLSSGAVLSQDIYGTDAINATVINSGGSGYIIGDKFTIDGGDQPAELYVDTVSSGAVVSYTVISHGAGYSVGNDNATTASTGVGTGCTIDISSLNLLTTEIYVDSPEFGFGDIVLLQPSADSIEYFLVISTYELEMIQNADGENINVFKYTVSRDFSDSGVSYSFKYGVAINGRGSYSVGNDPLPLASGDSQSAFGDYQPSGTFAGVGGGWISLDGENAFIGVNVRTGPLPLQYQEFIKIGNLQGVLTFDDSRWGFFIGDENNHMYYEQTEGLVIYYRDGGTQINEDGIKSDAFVITLSTGETTTVDTDTVYMYYHDDVIKVTYDNSGTDHQEVVAFRTWVSANSIDNVVEDTAPQAGADFDFQSLYDLNNVGYVDIDQTADALGVAIYGYDDMSAEFLKLSIDSSGYSVIEADAKLSLISGSGGDIFIHSANEIILELGDASGSDTVSITDSSSSVVASIDSDGDAIFNSVDMERTVVILMIDNNTELVTGDDFGSFTFSVPAVLNGYNLIDIEAYNETPSTSGIPTFQLHNVTDTQDMLSTALTIDATEYNSNTAATAVVINTSYDGVSTGDRLRFDCDVAGTGAKGISFHLKFELP